ncbi:uncharacterized protein LOC117334024 [Pecten maximus]|uniref:uncharacterized protein LOC117334024 n=1 Tax=Pecten maximus TaxID=6579 RepID=UPI0014586045|nr:uncharacterized protein LOC117334024 [Pecten maximus]
MARCDSVSYVRCVFIGVLLVYICNHRVYAYNLTCYTCTTTVSSDPCVNSPNETEVVTCAPDEPFCRVLRVDSQYGDLMSLTRGCTSVCKNHCGIWGEDVDEERCHSCCRTKLCNIGNGCEGHYKLSSNLLAVSLSIVYIVQWSLRTILNVY